MSSVHVHVIGFGSVGQALHRMLTKVASLGELGAISKVDFYAPEIKEARTDGPLFSFHPCPAVERETLKAVFDLIAAKPGDVLLELATRIDTITIWKEAKARGLHFINSGFDAWGDVELDLEGLDVLKSDPLFTAGKGPTTVFSMGMNPGVVNHFVRHGLEVATGIKDVKAAADAFGLSALIFSERDTQWPVAGSKGEALIESTQTKVLYNSWSPGNYIVETAESTLLWVGVPEGAKEINAASPCLAGWVPSGPILGFAPPHDECFTVQPWFGGKEIPALFVYEAAPSARFFLKSGTTPHSSEAVCKLLTPGPYDVREDCYDMIGVVLLSNKPGQVPFWCGLNMTTADAARIDPTRSAGCTPLEVTGGVWTALQYVIQHPNAGDCFPEDVPTDFVMRWAFPWSGRLLVRPAPEALKVSGFFDPAAPDALAVIRAGAPDAARLVSKPSPIHGTGLFAAVPLLASTALVQLPLTGPATTAPGFGFNHSSAPNAYLDRNRCVRTLRAVPEGEEITVEYAMTATRAAAGSIASVAGVTDWTALPASTVAAYLESVPLDREVEEDIYRVFGPKSF